MASQGMLLLLLTVLRRSLAQDSCVVHQLSYQEVQQLLTGSRQCSFASDNLLLALVHLQQEVQQLSSSYDVRLKAEVNSQQQPNLPGSHRCDSSDNK